MKAVGDEKKIHVPFERDDVKELSDHPIIKKVV